MNTEMKYTTDNLTMNTRPHCNCVCVTNIERKMKKIVEFIANGRTKKIYKLKQNGQHKMKHVKC